MEIWSAILWRFVRAELPEAPARVIELGCGPDGGLVPELRRAGYEAAGVDPEAPAEPGYYQVEFERYQPPALVHAVVACASLHHVADLGLVLDKVAAVLRPGGTLVVTEWAWERFDEPTARWCFSRLGPVSNPPGWLHRRREEWAASGLAWDTCQRTWAEREHCHSGETMLRELGIRFDRRVCERGPYFFHDLVGTAEIDEQAVIGAGLIQATGIRYAATSGQGP